MIHPNRMLSHVEATAWKLCTVRLSQKLDWSRCSESNILDVFSLVQPKKKMVVSISKYMFWGDDCYEQDQEVVMLMELKNNERESVARKVAFIGSASFCKPFFEGRNLLQTFDCLKTMLTLPPNAQIAACAHLRNGVNNSAEENGNSIRGMDIVTLKKFYDIIKPSLLPEQRKACDRWIAAPSQNHGREKLELMLSCNASASHDADITYESIMEVFDSEIVGFEEMKNAIARALVNTVLNRGHGVRILLHGLPGTGKTEWAQLIAKALRRAFKRINLGGMTSTLSLLGCEPNYENSGPGIPLTFLAQNGDDGVIGCDEVDKLAQMGSARGKDGEVMEALISMLDSEHPFLRDAYMEGVPVNIVRTTFVLTANRVENLPPELISRMDYVFRMEPYSEDLLLQIMRERMKTLEAEYKLSPGWITEDALREITRYRKDFGARDCVGHLRSFAADCKKRITPNVVRTELAKIVDLDDSAVRYHMHEFEYPESQRKKILELFGRRASASNLSEQEKRSLDLRLKYLTKLIPEKSHNFDVDHYCQVVEQRLHGMDEAKSQLAAELYTACKGESRPKPLLFAGPAGVGKSTFAEVIATCSGRKYSRLQANGVSDPDFWKGSSPEHVGADAGQPVRHMADKGTTNPVLYVDEIDKVDRRCAMAMLDLFDDSGKFYDQFLDTEIDISGALLMASCNDLSALDPVLLSRFTIINVPGYTANEKRIIATDYLLPELFKGVDVTMDDAALDQILCRYECDAGIRSMKHGLQDVIQLFMLEHRHDTGHLHIRETDVERILGAKECTYTADPTPGCVNSLAVAGGSRGIVSPIRVTMLRSGARRITGLAEEEIRDSISVAETWLEERFGFCLDGGFHIHFSPAGVKKNGSSAGVAIAMAMLSAVTGRDISDVAFTGEFDGFRVLPVGGCPLKIQAAKSAGLREVYVPEANRSNVDTAQFDGVDIVFVKTIDEVVAKLMPNIQLPVKQDHIKRAG